MASIDATLIETLFNMAESDVLDFKRDQYPFAGANDEEKGEIVKDIVALANAWKTTDAHIVIGAGENPGGRATVVGVSGHLPDANLQQLVNAKTNREVSFEYIPLNLDTKSIAIIRIRAVQQRPIFLRNAFGKLRANVVYVRRGSSTAEASLDEIERMWAASAAVARAPEITLELADPGERRPLGRSISVTSKALKEASSAVPSAAEEIVSSADQARGDTTLARREREELMAYLQEMALLVRLGFRAENTGSVVIEDARIVVQVPDLDDLVLLHSLPHRPQPGVFIRSAMSRARLPGQTTVTDAKTHWEIEARLGKIQPGAVAWSAPFWIGSAAPTQLPLVARVFGDSLPAPVEVPMVIEVRVEDDWLKSDGEVCYGHVDP